LIKKNKIPVSIVIPTLGHSKIKYCLEKIQSSLYHPAEILIVVPKNNYNKLKLMSTVYKKLDIRVILSKKKHQVHQRILGFKKSKFKYVMQLDDDVWLSKKCLYRLYEFIKGKDNVAVAPKYSDKILLSNIYKKPNNFILKFYHWLLNSNKGYAPGTISLSGYNYGEESRNFGSKSHEWLAGGAVIHVKKNLILNNYYKFNFKRSLCEDILHSLLLREKGIKLIKLFSAKANSAESSRINNENNFFHIFQNMYNEFLVRKYINKKFKLSLVRLYIFYFIYFLRVVISIFRRN